MKSHHGKLTNALVIIMKNVLVRIGFGADFF